LAAIAKANYPANPDIGKEPKYTHVSSALSINFIEYLVSISESTRRAWRRFHQYWWVLKEYSTIGYHERLYMIDRGVIGVLVDYYMGSFSPYRDSVHRVSIGDSPRETANLDVFMDLLSNLVRSTLTQGTVQSGTRPITCYPDDGPLAVMPIKCLRLLFNRDYFASMLKQAYNVRTNELICLHHSWEDEERSFFFLELIMKFISSSEDYFRVLFPVLEQLLGLKDSLQQWRVCVSLNYRDYGLLHMIDKASNNPSFVVHAIENLIRLMRINPVAAYYLYRTKEYWWPAVEGWLTKKRTFVGFEWKKLDNPEEKLAQCVQQLTDVFASIDDPSKVDEKDRIVLAWDQVTEERDKQERRFVRFSFNK